MWLRGYLMISCCDIINIYNRGKRIEFSKKREFFYLQAENATKRRIKRLQGIGDG